MTTDTKALIERLRDAAARKWPDPDVARHSLFAEAADTIARLTDEAQQARERADFCLGFTREAQEFAAHYADQVTELRANITRLEAERDAANAWRPIETAPKDGTRVLCVWSCAWGQMVYEGWCQGVGTARDGGDVWRSHSLVPVSGRPTLWMPLPAAPTQEGAPK